MKRNARFEEPWGAALGHRTGFSRPRRIGAAGKPPVSDIAGPSRDLPQALEPYLVKNVWRASRRDPRNPYQMAAFLLFALARAVAPESDHGMKMARAK